MWALTPDLRGKGRPERPAPLANCLVAYLHRSLGKEHVAVTIAEREAVVQPHRVRNDLGREAMAALEDERADHA